MDEYRVRDAAAIAGIGMTEFSANSGVSELTNTVRAAKLACEDAGVDPRQVDGFGSFNSYGEGPSAVIVAGAMGNPEPPNILMLPPFGGNMTAMILGFAAMAVASGTARYFLIYRAINGRSEMRIGGTGTTTTHAPGDRQFTQPFGMHGAAANFGMNAREYIHRYNVKEEDAAAVAVTFRIHAQRNPHARMYGRALTTADYLSSKYVVEPLRLLDCSVEVDGAAALLICAASEAWDLKQPPILIHAAAYGYRGMSPGNPRQQPGWHGSGRFVAPRLFARTEMTIRDIDVAGLADDFSYSFLPQLEDFGWCEPGQAAPFCADGQIDLGGTIPCNTSGGSLSEGTMHGLNLITETVTQLRGAGGARQVPDAEVALVTGTNGASAAILRRDR